MSVTSSSIKINNNNNNSNRNNVQLSQGDFSYISDIQLRYELKIGYQSVTILNLWSFLNAYANTHKIFPINFSSSSHKEFIDIRNKMEEFSYIHTESSFKFIVDKLLFIAQLGEDKLKKSYLAYIFQK